MKTSTNHPTFSNNLLNKIIFLLTLLLFVVKSFSQTTTNTAHSRDYYLTKSKNLNKAANILLAGGAVCILTAFLIPKGEEIYDGSFFRKYKNDGIRALLGLTGITSMLGSIPFYIVSAKNKRKANAATLSFNNQRVLFPQRGTFVSKTQPTLTLKIGL